MFASFRHTGEFSYYASTGPKNIYDPFNTLIRENYFNPPNAVIAISPGRPDLTYTPEKSVLDLPPT